MADLTWKPAPTWCATSLPCATCAAGTLRRPARYIPRKATTAKLVSAALGRRRLTDGNLPPWLLANLPMNYEAYH
jgi:hypothetical protein